MKKVNNRKAVEKKLKSEIYAKQYLGAAGPVRYKNISFEELRK